MVVEALLSGLNAHLLGTCKRGEPLHEQLSCPAAGQLTVPHNTGPVTAAPAALPRPPSMRAASGTLEGVVILRENPDYVEMHE